MAPAIHIHSRYDPEKEAERFVSSRDIPPNSFCIVITEPGESWCAPVLRRRFPGAILVALRYDPEEFVASDGAWNAVWRPDSGVDLRSFLFNLIPDEFLPLTSFIPWKPSDAVWPEMARLVWEEIAGVIRIQASVMHTRSHFGKRWLSNMIRNASRVERLATVGISDKPALLAAAGPSLERLGEFDRQNYVVYAVSSALSCLQSRGIVPDICVSTDGGFWVKDLFRSISPGTTVAVPLEAALPSHVLERNPVQMLDYGSALERELLDAAGIASQPASRNGTVSGTAALYALAHSKGPVYAAGLDLSPSPSFSHARPHPSDAIVDASTGRYNPLALALYERNRDTASLDMYAAWFSGRDAGFRQRFFRIGPAVRPIQGILTVSFPPGAAPAGGNALRNPSGPGDGLPTPDAAARAGSQPASPARRKERLAGWLERYAGRLRTAGGAMNAAEAGTASLAGDSAAESAALFREPVISEILQLVSYTDYVFVLRGMRTDGPGFSAQAFLRLQDLCLRSASFLEKLSGTVRTDE